MTSLRIGAAGWQTIRAIDGAATQSSSILQRYSDVFDCVEIDFSFFRVPSPQTFMNWAGKTPPSFRFAVRVPEMITHVACPISHRVEMFKIFVQAASNLGKKLGVLVFVLPEEINFNDAGRRFVDGMRSVSHAPFAFQPAHTNWLSRDADAFLEVNRICIVTVPGGSRLGSREVRGWKDLQYWRLHAGTIEGSGDNARCLLTHRKAFTAAETWLIGDNSSHAASLRRIVLDHSAHETIEESAWRPSGRKRQINGALAPVEQLAPDTYHLYFLGCDGAVSHVLALPFDSTQGAAAWVNQHKHEHTIEIWRDSQLVFVSPGADRRR